MENGKINAKNPVLVFLIMPTTTIFISSFCIMVLELVAARLIARCLGSSLYTWTAVIGIVLAGISLGNYLGGRIADRFRATKALALLFVISSLSCVLVIILNNIAGQWIWLWHLSWPARVFTHVFLVFMLPSTLLGTISPVVAKMALDRGLPSGRTLGAIYAWGAIGSIAGTFAAGYYLIDAMGTTMIVWLVGGILLLMGILYCARLWFFCIWAVVFLFAMSMALLPARWCRDVGAALALREPHDPSLIYSDETPYCYVSVKHTSKDPDKRVFMQDKLTHSKIVMDDINDLQYFYTKIYAAVTAGLTAGREKLSILVIGGGGYVYPRYVEKAWPGSLIEVVEIDRGVTEAAIRAFGLERNTTIKTITMDARNYIDQLMQQRRQTDQKKLYDFIYGDAVNDYAVPFQLLTKEFNDRISNILADDGLYMLTVIDVYEFGRYLGAVVNTLKQTFAEVYVMTEARMPDWARNTFVVVAAKRRLDVSDIIAKQRQEVNLWCLSASGMDYLKDKARGIILTDDYAPVENLLAPVVRRSAEEFLAHRYMIEAQKFVQRGRPKEGIAFYEKAAHVKPRLTTIAYSQIGSLLTQQADFAGAVNAYKKALEYIEQTEDGPSIAGIYFDLGIALENLNRDKEAQEHFRSAVQLFRELVQKRPRSAGLQFWLGKALVKLADFDAAYEAFKKAVELNPDDLSGYLELAKVLEFQHRYDEGIALLKKTIDYMQSRNRSDDVTHLRIYLEFFEFGKWRSSRVEDANNVPP